MTHYAQLDENNVVINVIVIEWSELSSGRWGDPERFVQTSYNGNIRKRFAGIGYTYDAERDAFIPPRPGDDWMFDDETLDWKPPAEPQGE
jgi:hypothetical protein